MIRYPAAPFDAEPGDAARVPSPCVNVCELDEAGVCMGCLRTTAEIAAWPGMDEVARSGLLEELERRRRRVGETGLPVVET